MTSKRGGKGSETRKESSTNIFSKQNSSASNNSNKKKRNLFMSEAGGNMIGEKAQNNPGNDEYDD